MRYYQSSEAAYRIRCLHGPCGPCAFSSSFCHQATRGGAPQRSGNEYPQTRTKAQAENQETFRLGPRFSVRALIQSFRSNLAGDFGPGQTLSYDLSNSQIKAVTVVHVPAVIEPKRLLIDVAEQVERLDADIGAVQSALQEAPEVLHTIGVYVLIHVLDRVIDDGMFVFGLQSVVREQFVGEDRSASLDVLFNLRLQFFLSALLDVDRTDLTAALHHAHDDLFAFGTRTLDATCAYVLMHVPRFAADEGFIDLDFSAKLTGVLFLQRQPQPLEHEPARFLSDSGSAGDFVGANAVLAIGKHPHRKQPLVQGDWRVLKDSPDFDRELCFRVPSLTLPDFARSNKGNVLRSTGRTYNPILPTPRREVIDAVHRIGKVDNRLLQGLRFARHEYIMGQVC